MELQPGFTFSDRWELVRRLGQGGMGEVWLGRHQVLSRRVAIKVLRRQGPTSPDDEARFAREARVLAGLSHPSIVQILDVGTSEVGSYVVMELVDGETLEQRLQRGPMPVAEAIPLFAELARALANVHRRGIVHRDIKPANLMLPYDDLTTSLKLIDFGIARTFDEERAALTQQGITLGTPAFLAPEALVGGDVGPAGDLYALGVSLFVALVGRPPFPRDDPFACLRMEPPSLRTMVDVPVEVEVLMRELLSRQPQDRPADAAEVARRLEACVGGVEEVLALAFARPSDDLHQAFAGRGGTLLESDEEFALGVVPNATAGFYLATEVLRAGSAARAGMHRGLARRRGSHMAGPAPETVRALASVARGGELLVSETTEVELGLGARAEAGPAGRLRVSTGEAPVPVVKFELAPDAQTESLMTTPLIPGPHRHTWRCLCGEEGSVPADVAPADGLALSARCTSCHRDLMLVPQVAPEPVAPETFGLEETYFHPVPSAPVLQSSAVDPPAEEMRHQLLEALS